MAEASPAPAEKNVVVTSNHLCRLWSLTIASLTLNVLILALLVIGAIFHHHHKRHRFGGRDGGRFEAQGQMGYGPRFHQFGGMGMNRVWGRPDGFRGDRNGGPGAMGGGPGMPGMGGMRGMMGGDKNGPPEPAETTDGILAHLSTALSLTDDQKAKIKPIVEQQVAEIQKQMEAQRQAMQKRIENAKAKLKPLLTPDQQKQLDAMPLPGQKPPAPDEAQKTGP